MSLTACFLNSILEINSQEWNAVTGTDYPFLRHEFLLAMEVSGSANIESGWQPLHLIVRSNDIIVAALPLYLKTHSYGEFVFDWSWADAYKRHGLDYYPKLLSAIPFTPATGSRLASIYSKDSNGNNSNGYISNDYANVCRFVQNAILEKAQSLSASSWHLLFPEESERAYWHSEHNAERLGCQYHWHNKGYTSFDDFLAGFSSRKRKDLKKERRRVEEQGIRLERLTGEQITLEHWQEFYRFYQLTYLKRSGHGGYLTPEFFTLLHQCMRDQLLLVLAYDGEQAIAGALNFFSSDTLYGRYWGAIKEVDCLHFEACYYQGIEFCIEKKLKRFDPGAQGEHKIQRGFVPTLTYSYHWIKHPRFRQAINQFLQEEAISIQHYQQDACALLPFKHQN